MFYTFDQNNSGGRFHHEPASGVGYAVIIEADSNDEACDKAELIGLYFNGCETGQDCDCCGDRWSRPWNETETPVLYGVDVKAAAANKNSYWWGLPVYIHYKDGTMETVPHLKDKDKA